MKQVLNAIKKSSLYRTFKKNIISLMYYLPVNHNKVVFDNFGGKGYGDDPKYIAEYLKKNAPGLKLVWTVNNKSLPFPKEIKTVKYGTIRAAFHYCTARVWIDNIKNSLKPKKKRSQYYIQTWHSTLGFKKNEADVENLPEKYVRMAKADAEITDLMYSNNDFRKRIYETSYWYSGPVMKCGVPRNTILFNTNEELHRKVYEYFDISPDKKIILYAPTFRKTRNINLFDLNYELLIKTLNKKFGPDYICLLRLHPNDMNESNRIVYSDYLKNASYYPDMQELLAAADVLITDYSGCMFDFSFARKPVFLYVKDVKEYLANERTLHFSFDEIPFSKAETFDELIGNIRDFNKNRYNKKCDLFFEKIGLEESGNGAEIIGNIVIDKCNNN